MSNSPPTVTTHTPMAGRFTVSSSNSDPALSGVSSGVLPVCDAAVLDSRGGSLSALAGWGDPLGGPFVVTIDRPPGARQPLDAARAAFLNLNRWLTGVHATSMAQLAGASL